MTLYNIQYLYFTTQNSDKQTQGIQIRNSSSSNQYIITHIIVRLIGISSVFFIIASNARKYVLSVIILLSTDAINLLNEWVKHHHYDGKFNTTWHIQLVFFKISF